MSISITQQKIKGGHEVLMVRDGSIRLLTFPLDMRALANEMCLEGNALEEEEYPALVKKYQGKRLEQARKPAPAPAQRLRDVIAPISAANSAALQSALAAEKARVDELAKNPLPKTTPAESQTYEWTSTMPNITHGNQPVLVTGPVTVLGELLGAAREAEIVLAFRKGEFTKAKAELAEAEDAAYKAWEAFNKELRTSLPESTRVKGVIIGSDNFFEQIIRTAQQMGGEVS